MNDSCNTVTVAILAFPETSASVVYGIYDLFMSAGRDWGIIVDGAPGPQLINPLVVSAQTGPFTVSNNVQIAPQATLATCPPVKIVCVPEVNVPPGEPLAGRYTEEIEWIKQRYAAGSTLATACSGAMLLAEGGVLDGHEATTH